MIGPLDFSTLSIALGVFLLLVALVMWWRA
jgi:hypothetical protein